MQSITWSGRVPCLAGRQVLLRTHDVALAEGILQMIGWLGHGCIAANAGHTRSTSGWVEACWLIRWCFCPRSKCLWACMIWFGASKLILKSARCKCLTRVDHRGQLLMLERSLVLRVYRHLCHLSLWGKSLRVWSLGRLLLFVCVLVHTNDCQVFKQLRQVQSVSSLAEFESVIGIVERRDAQDVEQLLEPGYSMRLVMASSRPRVLSYNKPAAVNSSTSLWVQRTLCNSLFSSAPIRVVDGSILSEAPDIIRGRLIITFGFTCTLQTWILCPCDPVFESELERLTTWLLFGVMHHFLGFWFDRGIASDVDRFFSFFARCFVGLCLHAISIHLLTCLWNAGEVPWQLHLLRRGKPRVRAQTVDRALAIVADLLVS